MKLRALTALVLIPPVVYLIVWAPLWLFLAALLLVVVRTAYEYFELSGAAGLRGSPWLGCIGCAVLCLAQAADLQWPGSFLMPVAAVLIVPVILTLALLGASDLRAYLGAACSTLFGIFYVGLMLSWLLPLRFPTPALAEAASSAIPPKYILLFLFLVIWAGDMFAYLVGRGIGKTQLFPRISPNKTLEGALGGLAGSLLVAWGLARAWKTPDLKTAMLLAAVVALAGQIGDLVESALKRSANLKDSGALLPGHGGLLDRVDSLIFGAPVLWVALVLMGLSR